MATPLQWDLFCRVIDNFGDIGVCWRLAADLGARGQAVRLWVDDPSALAWMAPDGASGVEVRHWTPQACLPAPGDVVIEAFGCDPPPAFVAHMARRVRAPLWINLEYLSAEAYVPRQHGLPSPQLSGPGQGLTKWFFYPGFATGSGGLIREPGLTAAREHFDGRSWLQSTGLRAQRGERLVSLFCYDSAPVAALLHTLSSQPTLLLVTPGAAQRAVRAAGAMPPGVRSVELPWMAQSEFDRLLWACDLNFVRGEDSFVRAQWAAAPFVWQIYAQHDAAHSAKLDAFLDLLVAGADAGFALELRALWRAWNGLQDWPARLPPVPAWQALARRWHAGLQATPDLVSQLLCFVHVRR
jgi:uncharacterized repeat protein (TIGR03837 family)